MLSLLAQHPNNATAVINQLFHDEPTTTTRKWYPKPDKYHDLQTFNPLKRRIYGAIVKLRQQEKLDPTTSDEQRQTFLNRFNWDDSQLTADGKAQVEHLLVKYQYIFAQNRLDIGTNTEFKVKLTPKNDDPVYAQSLPTPTNLKVELSLMYEYDVRTTLSTSKYSSSISAQR